LDQVKYAVYDMSEDSKQVLKTERKVGEDEGLKLEREGEWGRRKVRSVGTIETRSTPTDI
jgi:hypothetical protein